MNLTLWWWLLSGSAHPAVLTAWPRATDNIWLLFSLISQFVSPSASLGHMLPRSCLTLTLELIDSSPQAYLKQGFAPLLPHWNLLARNSGQSLSPLFELSCHHEYRWFFLLSSNSQSSIAKTNAHTLMPVAPPPGLLSFSSWSLLPCNVSSCSGWTSHELRPSGVFSHIIFTELSVQFSHSVVSDSLRPHESQHARPPCPSPTPRVYSNSCPSSWWCHPAISFSVVPFSSCPPSLPASGSFPMSQLFAWGGQSIGVSASASVLPMNTQDWSPSGWTLGGLILEGQISQRLDGF